MRISDWSSDVCSSDLLRFRATTTLRRERTFQHHQHMDPAASDVTETGRSEEHTSELQSLMRISYAVFCLKKKKKTNNIDIQTVRPLLEHSKPKTLHLI